MSYNRIEDLDKNTFEGNSKDRKMNTLPPGAMNQVGNWESLQIFGHFSLEQFRWLTNVLGAAEKNNLCQFITL